MPEMPLQVVTSHDVRTDTGLVSAGTPLLVVPSPDGGWLALPQPGAPVRPFRVPVGSVKKGKALLDSIHARHDYRFAREVLGWSHARALQWIERGYGRSQRQVQRWGFTASDPGVAA
ncbi:hypothetical protein [Nocardia spumae]|uniref:hypothetical protein n=1 Tax=Nocardia spumae TaxID=2887190 RepID=UPI001D14947D|nr:hypothetical protein [Nocardia spumae]